MTPAERARQIDREEFEAECAAIRQRAYARFNVKPRPDKRVREWIERTEPKHKFSLATPRQHRNAIERSNRTHAANAKLYEAFGHRRTLKEWAAETGMSRNTIRNRINLGWTVEQALTLSKNAHARKHSNRSPGVVSNLPKEKGTGAGSTAQETTNISFSGNENVSN